VSDRTLHIGAGLSLPLEAVTQTFGILGKRGVGKTHAASVIAEELLEHELQVVVLDPIGVWHGLRSSADGKSAGFPILVLGGDRGDLPLDAGAGHLVADFVVTKRASAVLDLGLMGKGDQARFVGEFLERLYQRNREPLHLIIDEADAFAPQRLYPGIQRCFGAVDSVVRRGRARGLGVTLVTQRSAAINKDVLTQIEVLVAFRTIAPQDRAAIEAWIEAHGTEAEKRQLLGSLATLEVGEAWWWSPAWLELFKRAKVRRRTTFDSSATPKAGRAAVAPKHLAQVDVEAFRTELAQLVTKADQEDPRRLRARVATLEREAATAKQAAPATKVERVEVPVLSKKQMDELEWILDRVNMATKDCTEKLELARSSVEQIVADARKAIARVHSSTPMPIAVRVASAAGPGDVGRGSSPASKSGHVPSGNGRDPVIGRSGLARMLTALAQRPNGLSAEQLGVRAGLSSRSGTFDTYLGRARKHGWIEGERGALRITAEGVAALGTFDPLPTGAELLDYWLRELGSGGAARMLRVLANVHPRAMGRAELAHQAGLTGNSGTFDTYLGRLRRLELIEGKSELRASEELFG